MSATNGPWWAVYHPRRPTFYLHGSVQGILSPAGAVAVANAVMGITGTPEAEYTYAAPI